MFGELIEIEERAPSFVLEELETKQPNLKVRNPAFDVTSPQDIDLIITERGVIPPQAAIMIVRDQKGPLIFTPREPGLEEFLRKADSA